MTDRTVTVRELADSIGVSPQTIEMWRDGKLLPTLILAFKIDEVTKGGVPPASWLGTDIGKAGWEFQSSKVRKAKRRG